MAFGGGVLVGVEAFALLVDVFEDALAAGVAFGLGLVAKLGFALCAAGLVGVLAGFVEGGGQPLVGRAEGRFEGACLLDVGGCGGGSLRASSRAARVSRTLRARFSMALAVDAPGRWSAPVWSMAQPQSLTRNARPVRGAGLRCGAGGARPGPAK